MITPLNHSIMCEDEENGDLEFHQFLNALHYEGYAEEIFSEAPELYEFEKHQFFKLYNF